MDMLDYRSHYAVMVTQDRIRDLRREATVHRRLNQGPRQATPRRARHRLWNVADLVALLVPKRERRPPKTTTSPKSL